MKLRLPDGRALAVGPRDRPLIVGILNLTPDSFSDGGVLAGPEAAAARGVAMAREGADVLDVGGESTRPGAARVPAAEQLRRVVPALTVLRAALERAGLPAVPALSIDTTRASVAEAALDAGASILNDVSAGRDDPGMLSLAARRSVPIVLMHMRGTPATMQEHPTYADVAAEVEAFLLERAAAAVAAGVPREALVLDPGIGFGKTKAHNLALLAALGRLVARGFPVLLGTSRKRFMGSLATSPGAEGTPAPRELVGATCATTALGVAAGVRMFRVHDVRANRQAADVAWAIEGAARGLTPP